MDAVKLGGFANLTAEQLATQTFHAVRATRRWRSTGLAPALAVAWLELLHYGQLAPISAAWDGWKVYAGTLHAPNGWTFTPGELLAIPLRYQQIGALEKENSSLRLTGEQLIDGRNQNTQLVLQRQCA